MKKLKSNVFNLMAIILLTLFLTSCEKQGIQNSSNEEITKTSAPELSAMEMEAIKNGSVKIFLPEEIALDNDKTTEYLHSLSANELYQHMLTHKIVQFLRATNNFEKFYQENPDYTFLTMDDLYKYAPNNMEEFKDFDPHNSSDITLRGCSIIASSCKGSTLIETKKCCYGTWPFRSCSYEIICTKNSSKCDHPCRGKECGNNQSCRNGYCYDIPTCSPKCRKDQICIGTECVYK